MSWLLLAFLIGTNAAAFLGLSHGDLGRLPASSYACPGWWLLTAGILLWAAHARDAAESRRDEGRKAHSWSPRPKDPQVWMAGIILGLAFLFRSAELDRLPWGYAGIHIDAAYNSELAFRILDGIQPFGAVMPSIAYVRDFVTPYYLAAFYGVFGRTIETLRLACNVLGLFDCFLVFLILRNYTHSVFAIAATLAAYAFSASDTIFAISGIYDIMAAPFLLGSFILFHRAMRRGALVDGAVAGFIWGTGFSSHYSYMYLGLVVPAVAVLNFKSVRPWLSTFLLAGLLGALPKLSYLIFHQADYFLRFHEVARHDYSAGPMGFLSANIAGVIHLLLAPQMNSKWFLPEDPIISLWQLPFVLLGVVAALLHPRRPEHALVLLVSLLTIAANVAAFVVDYRLMSAMPIIFLLFGMGFVMAEKVARGAVARALLAFLVGGGVIHSVAGYFSHEDNLVTRHMYGTEEVALARAVGKLAASGTVYVLAPRTTYRLQFFNLNNPQIGEPNDRVLELQFSKRDLTTTLANIERVLAREAARRRSVHFVINPASPYGNTVSRLLTSVPGTRMASWEVTDPVSRARTAYYLVSVEDARQAMDKLRNGAVAFRRTPANEAQLRKGMLNLTTFAGTDQLFVVDEREVPAVLNFDFHTRVPYPGEWRSEFSLRWAGYLWVTQGDYQFEATFDDGCRVFLDDNALFADWAIGGARKRTASVSLEAGWHAIRIDYFQATGSEMLSFEVRQQGGQTAPLSASAFASDPSCMTRAEMDPRLSEVR